MKTANLISYVLILAGFVASLAVSGQKSINPRSLKGKCKSLTVRVYCDAENHNPSDVWRKCYYDDCDSLFFDNNGNILKSFSFDENWNVYLAEFEYDGHSNRIDFKSFDPNGKLLNHTVSAFKLDSLGRVVEETDNETGSGVANKEKETKAVIKYDEKGNKTAYSLVDSTGQMSSMYIYKYNNNNNLTDESLVFPGDVEVSKNIYKCDERGNRTLSEYYNRGKLVSSTREKYDNQNNVVAREVIQRKGDQLQLQYRSIMRYNLLNDLISEQVFNEKGEVLSTVSYSYQYDDHENWIECIGYHQDHPDRKIVRRISYF